MKLINILCGNNVEFLTINPSSILGFEFQLFPRTKGYLICKHARPVQCAEAHVVRLKHLVQLDEVGF